MSNNNDTALRGKGDHYEALAYAKDGKWQEAIRINNQLLNIHDDPEAETPTFQREVYEHVSVGNVDVLNRIGKAYFEAGDLDSAAEAYGLVIEKQEYNAIARRMLANIERARRAGPKKREFVDMRTYAIETGKSTLTTLHIDSNVALSLMPGEQLYLRTSTDPEAETDNSSVLDVYDANDVVIGRIEPRLAARIIRFMRLGNQYIAAVLRISDRNDQIEIVIRESYRNPENRHEVSFPGKLIDENERRVGFEDIEDDVEDNDSSEDDVEEPEAESDGFGGDEEEHERLETLDSGNDDSDDNEE